jgi:hypothetical protein
MATRPFLSKREPVIKKLAKTLPKEFFKFKYFRFKCRDAMRTIDFYKSCGMTLDFDGEQESFKPVAILNTSQKTATGKTMDSTHMKKGALKEETKEEDKGPHGGPLGRIFGMSFAPMAGAVNHHRIQMIFEEDLEVGSGG